MLYHFPHSCPVSFDYQEIQALVRNTIKLVTLLLMNHIEREHAAARGNYYEI